MLASHGADSASVGAARDFVIKKSYVLFDTMISDGVREASKQRSATRTSTAPAAPGKAAASSAPAGKPKALDTGRFATHLPSDWEVAADDLERMGMLTVQRKGSGGAEAVYFKFEGPNWSGTPRQAIADFAKGQKGTPPEKAEANQIEFFLTAYEAFGTRQPMPITKKGTTKVTLTVLGDPTSPAVKTSLGGLVLK